MITISNDAAAAVLNAFDRVERIRDNLDNTPEIRRYADRWAGLDMESVRSKLMQEARPKTSWVRPSPHQRDGRLSVDLLIQYEDGAFDIIQSGFQVEYAHIRGYTLVPRPHDKRWKSTLRGIRPRLNHQCLVDTPQGVVIDTWRGDHFEYNRYTFPHPDRWIDLIELTREGV